MELQTSQNELKSAQEQAHALQRELNIQRDFVVEANQKVVALEGRISDLVRDKESLEAIVDETKAEINECTKRVSIAEKDASESMLLGDLD